ncbi:MAG: hypothetical protein H7641_03680 [Candidatus Heimdallarchaeota archaeon]|nr:hypothetical protein [Candidatus Heimdallarchaeota archaeon]MCK4876663.1 hypothetical protein [Candidatus Heimdallarchaeota archaeon]
MKHYNFDKVAVVYDNTRKVPDEIIARFKEEIRAFFVGIIKKTHTEFYH